jgi:hypothetical protein
MERAESPEIESVCLGCGGHCVVDRADVPQCARCYFRDEILKPMLDRYAPEAVIKQNGATGNLVVMLRRDGVKRHAIFRPPAAHLGHRDLMHRTLAGTYAAVRRLLDPNYVFDWQRHADLDEWIESPPF